MSYNDVETTGLNTPTEKRKQTLFATGGVIGAILASRSEEHTSELQLLMRISYAVFCLKKKNNASIIENTNLSKQQQVYKNKSTMLTQDQTAGKHFHNYKSSKMKRT